MSMAQQTAAGKGPSAATDLLKAQTAQTQANTNALASSAPGASQAEARRNAMMIGAGATQGLGAQAAAARSREQLGGESLAGELASQARGQDIQNAGLAEQAAMGNANLQLGQNQLNQQQAQFNAQQNQQMLGSMAGLGAGAMLAFADGDVGPQGANFVEPPGKTSRPAMITLREETSTDGNPFLLMIDQRTGKMQKVQGIDLTPEELQQVHRPHGAGPMDANSPNRQAKQMADGDVTGRPGDPPSPMRPRSFADVVRMAHSGLYADGDVSNYASDPSYGSIGDPQSGPTHPEWAPSSSRMPYTPPAQRTGAQPYDVQANAPSDEAVYNSTRSQVPESEADWNKATQLATAAGNGGAPAPKTGPTYYEDPALQNELHEATGLSPTPRYSWGGAKSPTAAGSGGGGGNPFFKALGGALAGYSNPKNLEALYGKRPVYQLQDTGTPTYPDGDINGQLDAAHKAEMTRGPTTVMVNREGDNESPVTKSSPVAEQAKPTAHTDVYPVPRPDASVDSTVTDFAAREGKDPYASLPQGLETTTTIGENSLIKNLIRGNPTQFSPFLSHDEAEGGMPKHMANEERPARPPQPAVPYDKRLPGVGFYSSTYMDGDIGGDPFVASTSPEPAREQERHTAQESFDEDIARLRARLDAEDAATRQDKRYRASSVDPTSTNVYYPATKKPEKLPKNPYRDADLTSKFAARPNKKRKTQRA